MEQIGFIGINDKKDLLLNVAKIISKFEKRVLIVDATMFQRLRYIVPRTSLNSPYISEYDGVDVAIGFMNLMGIAQYLGAQTLDYDCVLIDTDNPQTFNSFMLQNSKMNFFTTSYDEFELQKSLEILSTIKSQVVLTKLIFSSHLDTKHEIYLNHILENFPITWSEYKIEFPDLDQDREATLINHMTKEITLKNYSSTYKDSLEYLISLILEGIVEQTVIRKTIRKK